MSHALDPHSANGKDEKFLYDSPRVTQGLQLWFPRSASSPMLPSCDVTKGPQFPRLENGQISGLRFPPPSACYQRAMKSSS